MGCRGKNFSAIEFELLRRRWKGGESSLQSAEALGSSKSAIWQQIRRHGGLATRPGRRAERVLSLREREEISRGVAMAEGVRSLARHLARAPSTISREIQRHGGRTRYRASDADQAAGPRRVGPRGVAWRSSGDCSAWSSGSCVRSGRPSRSRRGW
jgi:Helix-turn-helix domain